MTDVTTTSTTTTSPTTITGPSEIISAALPEPGWKTSEFWLKLAALALTALYASGVIPSVGPVATGMAIAATILGALGYTVGRSWVKAAASRAGTTVVSVANENAPSAPGRGVLHTSLLGIAAIGLGIGAVSVTPSCAVPAPVVAAGGIVIDCVSSDDAKISTLVSKLWQAIANGGSWTAVEQQAIASGQAIGGCALAEVVQRYLAPPVGKAAPDPENGRQARAVLEHFRATYARGATWHTTSGDL